MMACCLYSNLVIRKWCVPWGLILGDSHTVVTVGLIVGEPIQVHGKQMCTQMSLQL